MNAALKKAVEGVYLKSHYFGSDRKAFAPETGGALSFRKRDKKGQARLAALKKVCIRQGVAHKERERAKALRRSEKSRRRNAPTKNADKTLKARIRNSYTRIKKLSFGDMI